MIEVIVGFILLIFGVFLGFFLANFRSSNKAKLIIVEAKKEAEQIKKEKILQAKEKFIELKSKHEQIINKKNNEINSSQQRVKQKENNLNQKLADINRKDKDLKVLKNELDTQRSAIIKKQEDLDKSHNIQIEQLEKISSLSAKEAKIQLIESLKQQAKTESLSIVQNTIEEAKVLYKMTFFWLER